MTRFYTRRNHSGTTAHLKTSTLAICAGTVALLAAFATLATLVTLTTPSHAAPIPEGAECIGPAAMADPFAQAQAGGLDLPGNFVDCDVLINKTDPCSKPGPGPDPSGPGTDKCYDPKGKDDCKPASSEDPTPPSKDCYGSLDDTDCDDKLEQNSDTANSGDDTLKGVACDPPSSSSSGGKLTGSGGSKDCIDRAAPVDPEPGKRINYCDGPERPLSPDQPGYAAKDECADKTEPTNPKPADPSDPTPLGNQLSDSSPGYGSGTLIKDKLHSVMLKCGQLPMLPNDGKKPGPSPTDDCPAGSASVDPGPTPEPKPQPKPDPTPEPKPDPDEQGPAPQPAPDPNPDPEPDPEPKPASGSPNDDANDDFYDGGKNDSPPTPGPAPGPDDPQPPAQHGDNDPCDDKRPPKGNSGSGGGNHAPSKNPNQLPGNVLADPPQSRPPSEVPAQVNKPSNWYQLYKQTLEDAKKKAEQEAEAKRPKVDKQYNAKGQLTQKTVTEPNGDKTVTEYEYGENGKLKKETMTNPVGNQKVTEYEYYADGQLKKKSETATRKGQEDPLWTKVTEYGENGKLTKKTITLFGRVKVYEYADGHVKTVTVTEPNGTKTVTEYDERGNPIKKTVTNPDGSTDEYEYAGAGEWKKVK